MDRIFFHPVQEYDKNVKSVSGLMSKYQALLVEDKDTAEEIAKKTRKLKRLSEGTTLTYSDFFRRWMIITRSLFLLVHPFLFCFSFFFKQQKKNSFESCRCRNLEDKAFVQYS